MKRVKNTRPRPGPFPRGEGEQDSAARQNGDSQFNQTSAANGQGVGVNNKDYKLTVNATSILPLPGERVGVRADDTSEGKLASPDFLIWQLMDSAFPTGGFAHSSGLEAAWQHGEVRGRTELVSFIEANLDQLGHATLPFVTAAFDAPGKLAEFDALCEVFTTNHVANRASRAQGRAFWVAVERIFRERGQPCSREQENSGELADKAVRAPFAHFAPVFGTCLRELNVSRETTGRMFFFNHLRSVLAAAVRLNIVGPMEAQMLQYRLSPRLELIRRRCEDLSLDHIAQSSPLLDLWQGGQDRLYSRLFQS